MFRFIFTILLVTSANLHSGAQTFRLQKAEVRFEIENAGIAVNGTFDSIPSINLSMPDDNPLKISVSGTLQAGSIRTGISIRDKHLRNRDYFDTEKYPLIYLQSTSVSKNGNAFTGNFTLQIKQTTKPVIIRFTMVKNGDNIELNGKFTINRKDYNVGGNSLILSDDVDVFVTAVFQRIP